MTKRNKDTGDRKKDTSSNQNWYFRKDFEVRPVNDSDKWCRRQKKFRVTPGTSSPYGYIVTVKGRFDKMKLSLDGYVIHSRLKDGNLLLQISEGHPDGRVDRKYVISIENREILKKVKAIKHKKSDKAKKQTKKFIVKVLNVRRL